MKIRNVNKQEGYSASITMWLQAIVAVFLLAAPNAVGAQSTATFHLTAVSVVGSKRYAAAEIARATGLKLGGDITVKSLDEAANKLGTKGGFQHGQLSLSNSRHGDDRGLHRSGRHLLSALHV